MNIEEQIADIMGDHEDEAFCAECRRWVDAGEMCCGKCTDCVG